MLKNKTIVITQSSTDSDFLKRSLAERSANVYECPSIRFERNTSGSELEAIMHDPGKYDFLLFTSRHAVLFFIETIGAGDMKMTRWKAVPAIAVGESTAMTLKENGFMVAMVPRDFTAAALVREVAGIEGKRLLLPRSQLADHVLVKGLEAKGASVIPFILYRTEFIESVDRKLEKMLAEDGSGFYFTFTSPSTVLGFTRRLEKSTLDDVMERLPAVCIGPVTAEAARKTGFKNVLVAHPHTVAGIVTTLLTDSS